MDVTTEKFQKELVQEVEKLAGVKYDPPVKEKKQKESLVLSEDEKLRIIGCLQFYRKDAMAVCFPHFKYIDDIEEIERCMEHVKTFLNETEKLINKLKASMR